MPLPWQKVLLISVCLLCYGNTVFNDYSLDDDFALTENKYVQRGIAGIFDILTHPYISDESKTVDYRPVAAITFAIEHEFFGNNPHVSHGINVVLYVLLLLILFSVLTRVFALQTVHPALPLLICLLFAVHPVHTEVVASIKNREELLSMLLASEALLLSHRFFVSEKKKALYAFLSIALMGLSYVTKATSLPFVPVIILTAIFQGFHKMQKRNFRFFSGALVAATLIYLTLGFIYVYARPIYDLENPLTDIDSLSIRLGTAFRSLWFYFKFMLIPYPHGFYYGFNMIPLTEITGLPAMVSLLVHLLVLAGGAVLFLRGKPAGLFALFYLGNIFMYSNFVVVYTGIVSERALFAPSLWFIAAGVLLAYRAVSRVPSAVGMKKTHAGLTVFSVILLLVFSALTVKRNFQWKNLITLMSSDIKYLNNSALANYFYAMALKKQAETSSEETGERQRQLSLAKKHLKRTLEIAPVYRSAFYQLGMIYEYAEQNRDSAFYYFHEGYHIAPGFNPLKFQFAKQLYLHGRYLDAERLFQQLYHDLPDDVFTLYFYAKTLFALGKSEQAFAVNNLLLQFTPRDYYAYLNAGNFSRTLGDTQRTAENYEKALLYGFRDEDVYQYLYDFYQVSGNAQKLGEIAQYR